MSRDIENLGAMSPTRAAALCAGLLWLSGVCPAVAQQSAVDPAEHRKKADELIQKAEQHARDKEFIRAAEAYLTVYKEHGNALNDDELCEVMYRTAINMEAARLLGATIKVRRKMIERFPQCKHVIRALEAMCNCCLEETAYLAPLDIPTFRCIDNECHSLIDETCDDFCVEQACYPARMATKIAGFWAMQKKDGALAETDRFENLYRKIKPVETTEVVFGTGAFLAELAEQRGDRSSWDEARKYLESFLMKHRLQAPADLQIRAWAFIGDAHRSAAGSVKNRKAVSAYQKALKLFRDRTLDNARKRVKACLASKAGSMQFCGTEEQRIGGLMSAVTKARYYLALRGFDAYMSRKAPAFRPGTALPPKAEQWWRKHGWQIAAHRWVWPEPRPCASCPGPEVVGASADQVAQWKSEAQQVDQRSVAYWHWLETVVEPWFSQGDALLDDASEEFTEIAKTDSPEWAAAAAARIGDMQRRRMQDWLSVPPAPGQGAEIWRHRVQQHIQPIRQMALEAYEHCFNTAVTHLARDQTWIHCEKALNELAPGKYPVTGEITAKPDYSLPQGWAVPGPILEQVEK